METQEVKKPTISDEYFEAVNKKVKASQESGDIPTSYSYNFNQKTWVMTLPRSVMAQKHLVYIRDRFFRENSFETEEALINAILANTTVAGHQVSANELELGELEVLKTAYLDELLLPLSLGGGKAVSQYMSMVLGKKQEA